MTARGTFKPGDVVTWGSGAPLGKVVDTFYGDDSSSASLYARVALLKEQVSPCGKRWPVGHEVSVPESELRPVQ